MKKMNKVNLTIIVAGLLGAGLIFVADASAADNNACSADIAKFCANIEPGPVALMDCLEKHENELTSACQEYETKMGGGKTERKEQVREIIQFRQACLNDMAKFCNDAGLAPGGMLKCLNDHTQEISASCSESIKVMVN